MDDLGLGLWFIGQLQAYETGQLELATESTYVDIPKSGFHQPNWHKCSNVVDNNPICSMVLVHLPTKLSDFLRVNVGKYSSTMEHLGMLFE